MAHTEQTSVSLVQFLPPWRFGASINRFALLPDGRVVPDTPLKVRKALRKPARRVDGLLLRPTWPGRAGLALVQQDGNTTLHRLHGNRIDPSSKPMRLDDPNFAMHISERGLYRVFTFEDAQQRWTYRDLAGRLVAPQRMAADIFPEDDFSPFARLIGMLRDDALRAKLLSDFAKHRFRYGRWVSRPDRQLTPLQAQLQS